MLFQKLFILIIGSSLLLFTNCKKELKWQTTIENAGTYSSPKSIDLNGDNMKDIVIGAGGKKEWDSSENGVIALNGKNGQILWKIPCDNQIVGSAIFKDIDSDGSIDVFIGGRSNQLFRINGATGALIWEFSKINPEIYNGDDTTLLNFYSPQFIPDQDNDNREDLLTAYGGFVKARAFDPGRPAGYLMIISSSTGKIIAQAPMPDGKETYMSPVVDAENNKTRVFFGTGGESLPGNFYVTDLEDIKNGKIEDAKILIQGKLKGFIAPPVIADINNDQKVDIIVNAYEGITYAIDGASHELIWEIQHGENLETHSQPAIGNFTGDNTPDLLINLGKGSWPEIIGAVQIIVDGKTGSILKLDSIGYLQYASPVTIEKSQENYHSSVLPITEVTESDLPAEAGFPSTVYSSNLLIFHPDIQKSESIKKINNAINIGSTVLIDDLDGNGEYEIVFVYNKTTEKPFVYSGFTIECIPLPGYSSYWNQYMGPEGKSIYNKRRGD